MGGGTGTMKLPYYEEIDEMELKKLYINKLSGYNSLVPESDRMSEKTMPDTKYGLVEILHKMDKKLYRGVIR